jgi:hypothetical protein
MNLVKIFKELEKKITKKTLSEVGWRNKQSRFEPTTLQIFIDLPKIPKQSI